MEPPSLPLRRRRLLAAACCAGLPAGAARAEEAAAALRLLVAYAAGGPADLVARQLAGFIQQQTARAPRVENLPGAGGGLGVQRLLGGAADGSQLLVGTPSETIVVPLINTALQYRPEQLRLVGLASHVQVALVAGPHITAPDLAALLAAARAGGSGPGLSYGSYGMGSLAHLAGHDFARRVGLPLLHVPFGGAAPLLRELAGGRVDLAFMPLAASVTELAGQGRLRLLALAAAQRDARRPQLPTVEEAAGIADCRHDFWTGLFLPRRAGESTAQAAQTLLERVLREPAYQQLKRGEGIEPGRPLALAQAERFHAAEIERYQRLVSDVSLRLE